MNFERGKNTKYGLNVGIFRDRERKTGKTTKTVDEAIQFLFKSGNICIPSYSKLTQVNPVSSSIINAFIDPDAHINSSVQENLWGKILDRLRFEHAGTELEINKKIRVIKIKY